MWQHSRNHRNQIGLFWTGPFDRPDAVRQTSALDALNAALAVAGETQPTLPSIIEQLSEELWLIEVY
jgi:hypothetical protein